MAYLKIIYLHFAAAVGILGGMESPSFRVIFRIVLYAWLSLLLIGVVIGAITGAGYLAAAYVPPGLIFFVVVVALFAGGLWAIR